MSNKKNILICRSVSNEPKNYADVITMALKQNGFNVVVLSGINFFSVLKSARKADIIFSFDTIRSGVVSAIASKIFKKKLLVRVAGDYVWEMGMNKKKARLMINDFQKSDRKGWLKILHKLQSWTCSNAHTVVVPSKYLAKIVSGWGISKTKIAIINNGINFKKAEIKKEEARSKIGVHGNIILSVGKLYSWKGFKMLVKLMPRLFEISQFFRLVIVGDGPDEKMLRSIIKNMRLDNRVVIVGDKTNEELALYMAAADIFVLNSAYEVFPNELIEAMKADVPIVTTTSGANPEVIKQGDNGLMVKYNNEFDLVEAIKVVWRDKEIKEKFIERGRETASKYTEDNMIENTIQVISNL
ncbi:MAG: hypothetical protein COV29_02250 [Candidatus Yanofskybacteria bacterium CG10_big_fil_rev_8_21_14_0_10_36_16]|uniref:Uncharacterized protein n=1 Tax=Candidatus Yanofskybacteria bacterium CG10_big_fil_rev_8_21_14_0_10_36_16 TaxID=1975096 RepID=A0A2J0Q7M2_9BACT|nr:MAG: hypothetical protein COV29_02250 [Candidatus Yanofskybacteria bacterium CG10_big_fil_rev_8_21_14_0_10_36_16]